MTDDSRSKPRRFVMQDADGVVQLDDNGSPIVAGAPGAPPMRIPRPGRKHDPASGRKLTKAQKKARKRLRTRLKVAEHQLREMEGAE